MNPPYHEMSPMRVLLKITRSDPPGLELPHKWYIIFVCVRADSCVHKSLHAYMTTIDWHDTCMCVNACMCTWQLVFVMVLYLPTCRSKEFNNFLARCLTKNPESRDSASELLQHPFLSSVTDHKPLRALYQVTREIMHNLYQCCPRPNMCKCDKPMAKTKIHCIF